MTTDGGKSKNNTSISTPGGVDIIRNVHSGQLGFEIAGLFQNQIKL